MGMVSKDVTERATKGKPSRAIIRAKTQWWSSLPLILFPP